MNTHTWADGCPRCIQYEPSYRKLLERLRIEEPS